MMVEGYVLIAFVLGLAAYVWLRLRYGLKCPRCGRTARRTKIQIGFLVSQGRKKMVRTAAGACMECGHMWTLRNTQSRRPGIITISKGTVLRRR